MPDDTSITSADESQEVSDDSETLDQSPGDQSSTFTQEQVNHLLRKEKDKWKRQAKKQPQPQDNNTDLATDLLKLKQELETERQLNRFEKWLSKKDVDPRANDLLGKAVDLSDPDSWEASLETYGDLFRAQKKVTQQNPAPQSGGTNSQPDQERPPINPAGDLDPERFSKLPLNERMKILREHMAAQGKGRR